MKRFLTMAAALIIGLFVFTGCQGKTEETAANKSEGFVLEYPEKLKKKFGESLKLDKTPDKIVVMTATPVQALYELGIKMEAIPESSSVDWPEDLDAKKLPFEMVTMDVESVMAEKPDLLILSEYSADQYKKTFEENGIPCYFTSAFKNIETTKQDVNIFAKAFGKEKEGKEILSRFKEVEDKIAKIAETSKSPKTLVMAGYPFKYVQTKDGFTGQMMSMFNIQNITEDADSMAGMSPINMEEILSKNPSLIVAIGSSKDEGEIEKAYKAEFAKNPEVWNKVDAVKNNNIVYLDKSFERSAGIRIVGNLNVLAEKFAKGVQ